MSGSDEKSVCRSVPSGTARTIGASRPTATQIGASTSHAGIRRPQRKVNAAATSTAAASMPRVIALPTYSAEPSAAAGSFQPAVLPASHAILMVR
ncbi:hypothetical protein ACFQY7_54785 [Actinomadura luteofluorescens]|uniref:hypothetical protein n=1 Tax=Actinomadura luteofluorescens TaxID=46163 RepID=UPI003642BF7A